MQHKGLQAPGLPDEVLRYCQMKKPVEHYPHAKERQALLLISMKE